MDSNYYTEQVYGTGFISNASCNLFKIINTKNFLRLACISYVLEDIIKINYCTMRMICAGTTRVP
jgi:hypothetical protein